MIRFARKTYKFDKSFNIFLVSNDVAPHFDVNFSNLTTMVNFYVTMDGLQAQMLGLVVANERKDLEERYTDSSKEAFDNIKTLKEIENSILDLLAMDIDSILKDENLINTLNDSKNTAEFIASKLKSVNQASASMSKSREVYQPVAFRAATLYFAVSDLVKVNPMYRFSLDWFIQMFVKSMSDSKGDVFER